MLTTMMMTMNNNNRRHGSGRSTSNRTASSLLLFVSVLIQLAASTSASSSSSSHLSSNTRQTLVDLLSTSSNFQLMYGLLNATQVGLATNKFGHLFTIFAPTDDVVLNLPLPYQNYFGISQQQQQPQNNFWNLHAAALASYHVVPKKVNASAIAASSTLSTLDGNDTIVVNNSTHSLSKTDANITQADVEGFNGLIQVINEVLIPDTLFNTSVASRFTKDLATTYTIFAALLQEAELYSINFGYGSIYAQLGNASTASGWTLFVPSDDAIRKYTPGLEGAPGIVAFNIVLYHIAPENIFPAGPLRKPQGFYAVDGFAAWFYTTSDGKSAVNTANITNTYLAGNGVINILDEALIPLDVGNLLLVTTLAGAVNFTDFYGIVQTNFPQYFNVSALSASTYFTVFAPADAAFQQTTANAALRRLSVPVWSRHLQNYVRHHFFNGTFTAADFAGGPITVTMDSSYQAVLDLSSTGVLSIDAEPCFVVDLTATDGNINGLSSLIFPPWYYITMYQLLANTPDFSTVIALIDRVNLTETLNSTAGPITFFAPDNNAFAQVGGLSSYSDQDIHTILMGHIFNDNVFYEDLLVNATGTVVASRWAVTVSNSTEVYVGGGLLYDVNNLVYNGVANAIHKVLIPANLATSAPAATPTASSLGTTGSSPASAPVSKAGETGLTSVASSSKACGAVAIFISLASGVYFLLFE